MAAHAKLIKDNEDTLIHVMCEGLRDGGFIEDVLPTHDDEVDHKIQQVLGRITRESSLKPEPACKVVLVRKRGSKKQERGGQNQVARKGDGDEAPEQVDELEACVKLEVETKKTEEQNHAVQADVEDHQAEGVQEHVGTIKERQVRGGEIHNQEEGSEGEEEVENAQHEQIRQMLRPHAQEEHQKWQEQERKTAREEYMKRLKIELPGKGNRRKTWVRGWTRKRFRAGAAHGDAQHGRVAHTPRPQWFRRKGRRKDSTNNCSDQTSSQSSKESTREEASTGKQQWCRTVKVQQERQSTEMKVERRKVKTHSATSGRSTRKTLNKLIKKTERTNGIRLTCS